MRYVALVLFGVLISTFILALRHSEGAAREDLTARFVFILIRLLSVEGLLGWLVPVHHELLVVVVDDKVMSLDVPFIAVAEILV